MPFTTPSTAWSSGASSNTMFAALPPSSSVRRLSVPAIVRRICLPTSVEPVNATLSTSAATRAAPVSPAPVSDVDCARRQLRRLDHLGEKQRGERRRLRRLQDGRVAGGEGRRELPRRHQHREVPWDHLSGHADRLRVAAGERVVELVRPARVVEEVRGGERQVDVARLLDRLAAVHRLQDRELAGALLERAGDPVQVLRPLAAGDVAPAGLERVARRGHRELDVLGTGFRHLGEDLFGGRIDRRHVLAALRLDELPTDEQPVAVLQSDDVLGLRRVRVLPRGNGGRASRVVSSSVICRSSPRNGSPLPSG